MCFCQPLGSIARPGLIVAVVLGWAACSSGEARGGFSASAPSTVADTREIAETSSAKQAGGEQDLAGDFYGVLLKWAPSGADPRVHEWLEGQGLAAMPMKAGMLTLASPSQIEKSFGVSVEGVQPPFELPVPEELRPAISSITVLKPRSYH